MPITIFDYVNVVPRNGDRGYRVHFHKDQYLHGMSTASIIFEGDERFLLAEDLPAVLERGRREWEEVVGRPDTK